jgi:hypothetical protein
MGKEGIREGERERKDGGYGKMNIGHGYWMVGSWKLE